jgi:hypothetical protein
MKICAFLAALLVSSVSPMAAAAESTPTLHSLMTKHIDAMGGLLNWNRVESIRLSGTVERDAQTVDIVIVKKRPNKIRATVTVPIPGREGESMQLIRAHDGKAAWSATRLAGAQETVKTEMTGAEAASLLADAGVLPKLIQFWRANEPLNLVGTRQFEGREVSIIELETDDAGISHRFFLDTKSHLLTAHETESPAGKTLTRLSAYEKHAGVYLPTHFVVIAGGTDRSVMRTDSIQIGVGIYAEYFGQVE